MLEQEYLVIYRIFSNGGRIFGNEGRMFGNGGRLLGLAGKGSELVLSHIWGHYTVLHCFVNVNFVK